MREFLAGTTSSTGEPATALRTAVSANSRHGASRAATCAPSPGVDCAPVIISTSTATCPASRSSLKIARADSISSLTVVACSSACE